jgi:hypothetical protein
MNAKQILMLPEQTHPANAGIRPQPVEGKGSRRWLMLAASIPRPDRRLRARSLKAAAHELTRAELLP